jgi:hypothetical protein
MEMDGTKEEKFGIIGPKRKEIKKKEMRVTEHKWHEDSQACCGGPE